jgi:hypothetical protein
MSPHGRPKGELTGVRQHAGLMMLPHGRPKGELTGVRQHAGLMTLPHGRPKGDGPRLAGRRTAPGVHE